MSEAKKLPIGELFELEKGMLQSLKNSPGKFDFITAADEWKTHDDFSHDMEALIFAAAASGSLGRTHYVNGKFITSDLCYILTPKNPDTYPIDLKFYHFVFNSLKEEIVKETKSGTSKESINQKSFKAYELPYFDIEKQHLWIQKLVNTKQHQQALLLELHRQKELVSKLRQSILQEAIEGKLTVQWRKENPDVESASKFLEKIQAEKEQLLLIKKFKKQKPLSTINEDEIPFKIPKSWQWCRLDDICFSISSGSTPSQDSFIHDTGIPYLKVYNIKKQKIDFDFRPQFVKEEINNTKLKRSILYPDDVVMNIVGPPLGKIAIIPNTYEKWNCNQAIVHFKLVQQSVNKYLYYFLRELSFLNAIDFKGMAGQDNISVTQSRSIVFPLPPLEEQSVIVEKIENLFAMCDELEQQINDSKVNAEMLMQAVLKEAFEEKSEPQAPKTFQRSVLAAYLIDNSQNDPFFGHVKLQKMLFMCEAVNNLDFDTDYKRHAMGPHDPKLIRSVDSQLKKAKWFEVKKLEGEISRYVYHPLEKVEEYKKYVGRYWDHKKIEHIFQLMKPMRTLQAEIVATLYSASSDLKKTNISITDAILINEARNNWHDNKKNIAVETWEKAIEWMKNKNLL